MVIGLIGFKQVGKSTAAKYLESKYDYTRLNMKDGLIAHITERFPDVLRELGIIYRMTIPELFEKKPPAMRALMVNVGTDDRRRDNEDFWTEQWRDELEYLATLGITNVVTDDIRFLNEADCIKSIKDGRGILIRLTRPDITTGGDHRSETEQLQIVADYTVECELGNEHKLHEALDLIIKDITGRYEN